MRDYKTGEIAKAVDVVYLKFRKTSFPTAAHG